MEAEVAKLATLLACWHFWPQGPRHYAPAIGKRYLDAELNGRAPEGLKLKGVGVGNGLTNPSIQYKYNADFAYGGNPWGIKAVNETVYETMKGQLPRCLELIAECNNNPRESNQACVDSFVFCNDALEMPYVESGRNIYDVRTKVPVSVKSEVFLVGSKTLI